MNSGELTEYPVSPELARKALYKNL